MATAKITLEDWSFFEIVANAAFANPFGRIRDDLDARIGGTREGAPREEVIEAAIARIDKRIDDLAKAGLADLRKYEGERHAIFRDVLLFHAFHRNLRDFDDLIRAQMQKGDATCAVPFSRSLLDLLRGFGFPETEAMRYFAGFYQLRRAFYFIRDGLVGSSPSMRELRMHLWNCVATHDLRWFGTRLWNRMEDFSVLLLGETGTGKGAAAAAVGRSGFIPFDPARNAFAASFTRNFVAINLSQYSEGLIESELFGHRKGAFTGAVEDHEGLFARCAPHGVIFIDEIGDLCVPVQIKLLQVLQDRIFFPVGSHAPRRFSGRVIAATNQPLHKLRLEGKFRDDLYYRLSSDVVEMPPLRRRLREDPVEFDLLLDSILSRVGGEAAAEKETVKRAILEAVGPDYPWPGNVRELEQAVKRVILTGRYVPDRSRAGGEEAAERVAERIEAGDISAGDLLASYCASLYRRHGTYEEVARRTRLDRRTAKKYVQAGLAVKTGI